MVNASSVGLAAVGDEANARQRTPAPQRRNRASRLSLRDDGLVRPIPPAEHSARRAPGRGGRGAFRPDSAMKAFDSDEALVSDVVFKVAISELPTAAVKEASHRWRAARWPRTKGARRSALDPSSIETFGERREPTDATSWSATLPRDVWARPSTALHHRACTAKKKPLGGRASQGVPSFRAVRSDQSSPSPPAEKPVSASEELK